MKLALISDVASHVATIQCYKGDVHLEMSDLEPVLEPVDARAFAAILLFAASEAER